VCVCERVCVCVCVKWKDCAAAAEAQSLEAVAVGYNMFTTNINKEGRYAHHSLQQEWLC